ncbi:antibiotic biosynthesis monooxygenase [Candidatus Poribacteria bacterium]|nr:antibiotic biosynthesis monooxygenase [Candidatus Poribacteria bacterium]
MLFSIIAYRAKKGKEREFEELMCERFKSSQEEAGCRSAQLLKKKGEERSYLWVELWGSEEEIEEAHKRKLVPPEHPIWVEISRLFESVTFLGRYEVVGERSSRSFHRFLSGFFGREGR